MTCSHKASMWDFLGLDSFAVPDCGCVVTGPEPDPVGDWDWAVVQLRAGHVVQAVNGTGFQYRIKGDYLELWYPEANTWSHGFSTFEEELPRVKADSWVRQSQWRVVPQQGDWAWAVEQLRAGHVVTPAELSWNQLRVREGYLEVRIRGRDWARSPGFLRFGFEVYLQDPTNSWEWERATPWRLVDAEEAL